MPIQFFNIQPATGTKETGRGFPTAKVVSGYSFSGQNSMHQLNHFSHAKYSVDIRFDLIKGAKLCDMMTQAAISGSGFLVSKELKIFLQNFNLGNYVFYEATINDGQKLQEYYWLHIVWKDRHKIVDFEKTNFFKKKYSNNLGVLDINSFEEFEKIRIEMGGRFMIGFDKLVLKTVPDFDLWPVPFRGYLIVSSELKKALIEKKFTGIEYSENQILTLTED